MQDRESTYPGRVRLIPVEGQDMTFDVERADEPTQVGTALVKNTLLRDSTEETIFGSADDRTVDDAFQILGSRVNLMMGNMASIALTVKTTTGRLVPGVRVVGIVTDTGETAVSNASGVVNGYMPEGSVTLSIPDYADIVPYSEVMEVTRGNSYTKTITVTRRTELTISQSRLFRFSGLVKDYDVCAVGGGAGGGSGAFGENFAGGGSGGGGGYVVNVLAILAAAEAIYQCTIGAGGTGGRYLSENDLDNGYAGSSGGTTTLVQDGMTIATARGGNGGKGGRKDVYDSSSIVAGGTGNGDGGRGTCTNASSNVPPAPGNGGNGTVYKFNETSLGLAGGAGGGGAGTTVGGGTGGSPNGGSGGSIEWDNDPNWRKYANAGAPGAGPGGGGGGGCGYYDGSYHERSGHGGNGAAGAIFLRWRDIA